jgi:hypothetical protein
LLQNIGLQIFAWKKTGLIFAKPKALFSKAYFENKNCERSEPQNRAGFCFFSKVFFACKEKL